MKKNLKRVSKTLVQTTADSYYKTLDKVLALKTATTGSWFLLNMDKHKTGKKKGKYKYIKFVGLDWNKTNAPRQPINTQLDSNQPNKN